MKRLFTILAIGILTACTRHEPVSVVSGSTDPALLAALNKVCSTRGYNVDSTMVAMDDYDNKGDSLNAQSKAIVKIIRSSAYINRGSYELALRTLDDVFQLLQSPKDDTLKALAYAGLGHSYKHNGDYPKAQANFYRALSLYERHNSKQGISSQYANLGEMFMLKGDLKQAKENLSIAMEILSGNKGRSGYVKAAHSLANVYGMNGEYDKALELDAEGIRIADSLKSPSVKVTFLDNKANCFLYSNQLDSAGYYFRKCLEIDQMLGNPKQIADTYSNLGALATARKNFSEAESWLQKSIDILSGVNNAFNLTKAYQLLADVYVKQGDYKKAYLAQQKYQEMYRKMISERKEEALAQFRVLHESEKNERLLAKNRLELLKSQAEISRRNSLLVLMGLLVVFIGLIGYFISRQHKLRNRQLAQEHELKSAILKIETQNKLQQQRLEISRDLHDNIGAQLTFIISSVDNLKYAFDLRDTKLDQKLSGISNFARDTIVELRDTIWAMNHASLGFEDFRARIMNFIEKARESHENIQFRFQVDPGLGESQMTSVVGMNIYRTIQEAVNNALKHSGAMRIDIDVVSADDTIQITVFDNGSGFDPESVLQSNGLRNMQKRIAESGGTFSLQSRLGDGTRIVIDIPKNLLKSVA